MVLLVGNRDIESLLALEGVAASAFAMIEGVAIAAEAGDVANAIGHGYVPVGEDGRYSLLTHALPGRAISLRWFPGDGTDAASRDGTVWLMMDPDDGRLVALFGADVLSPLRTALPSLACARALCDGPPRRIAIIGTGRQALAHARMLGHAFPSIGEVRFWSPRSASREAFEREAGAHLPCPLVNCVEREDALAGSELIFLLGPPNTVQLDEHTRLAGPVVVTVGSSVPESIRSRAEVFVPYWPPARERTSSSVADLLSGGAVGAPELRMRLLDLGGLYEWDAPIVRWVYEECRVRGIGHSITLD